MFTGIIEAMSDVLEAGSKLRLARPKFFDDLKIGCSIAVSGACLTVTAFDSTSMSFDVIGTTDKKTKLGSLAPGDFVNLERAMKADGRFEGHIVTGHVEGVGTVVAVTQPALIINVPSHLLPFIVLHGTIMIDGVALTVSDLKGSHVTVSLIPHTLDVTTLGNLKKGDSVNLETDILAKYLQNHGR